MCTKFSQGLEVKYNLERLCCYYVFSKASGFSFGQVGFGMMSMFVISELPGSVFRAKEKDKDKNKQAFQGRFGRLAADG